MPTYRLRCHICGDYDEWASITGPIPSACPDCQGDVVQVLTPPALYAVGDKGSRTREVDTREAEWSKDMPAYKRLRHAGYQPQRIDGADRMEATATSEMEINSGGIVTGPEDRIRDAMAMSKDIMAGNA